MYRYKPYLYTLKELNMYYLFMTKKSDLNKYKIKFDEVKQNIENGKTPVFN